MAKKAETTQALTLVKPPTKGRGRPFVKGDPRAGRPKGRQNDLTVEVREAAQRIVQDPDYLKELAVRLKAGRAPAVEILLWHYAYGRPKEQVQTHGTLTVRWLRPGEEEETG